MPNNLEATSAATAVPPTSRGRLSSDKRLKAPRGDAERGRPSRTAGRADAAILVAPTSSATGALLAIRTFLETFGKPKRPVAFDADGACTTLALLPEAEVHRALNAALSALRRLADVERDEDVTPNDHSDLLLRSMLADLKTQGLLPATAARGAKEEL